METKPSNGAVAAVRLTVDEEGRYRAEIQIKDFEYAIVIDKCASIEDAFKEVATRVAGSLKPRPL